MVARNFQALTRRRAERARELSGSHPAARAALEFLAYVADFQAAVDPAAPLDSLAALVELTCTRGPQRLADAARGLRRESCQSAMDDYLIGGDIGLSPPQTFFARVLLQTAKFGVPARSSQTSGSCPCCAHLPQAGALRPLGHGQALWLVCSLCLHEWELPRNRCIACGQTDARRLAYFKAGELPHIQVMSCEECRQYVHLIDLEKEPRAVADIDEIVALPLDVWAIEQGFSKLQPNLAGI